MAENQKYNLKDELLKADETMKGALSLLGMTMLTQPSYNNSMRSVMFTSHLKQFVDQENPDFPGFFTNGENLVGKHSSGYKKAKHDLTVYRKVEKFGDLLVNPFVYTLFVYDQKKHKFDVIERKDSEDLTEVFGYSYNNEVIDQLEEGDEIKKDTVLYRSKSYDEDMNYRYGKNVTMMYTTEPYTSEDACIVSESLAKDMTSIEVNTVTINQNHNDFLLDLYGNTINHIPKIGETVRYSEEDDDEHYKPFPDVGEYADGEVAVKRTLTNEQLLTDFKDSSLKKIQDSDVCYYKSGQVIDITIYCNNTELEDTPFNRQVLKYLDSQTKYYEDIKQACEEIMEMENIKYTKNLEYLYKRACEFLSDIYEPGKKKWKDNNSVFGNLQIHITLKSIIPLQIGQKLTGCNGWFKTSLTAGISYIDNQQRSLKQRNVQRLSKAYY